MKFLTIKSVQRFVLLILLMFTVFWQVSAQKKTAKVRITVDYERNGDTDSLTLVVLNTLFDSGNEHHQVIHPEILPDGKLLFKVNSDEDYGYFSLERIVPENEKNLYSSLPVANNYFWEKGDNVSIKIRYPDFLVDIPELTYTGNGASKYSARYELFKSGIMMAPAVMPRDLSFIFPSRQDSINWKSFINRYSPLLSKRSFDVLKADFLFRTSNSRGVSLINQRIKNAEKRLQLSRLYDSIIGLYTTSDIDKNMLAISKNYARCYINDLIAQGLLHTGKIDPTNVYKIIAQQANKALRDKLFATFFFANKYDANTPGQYFASLGKISDEKIKAAMLEIGTRFSNKLGDYIFFDKNRNKVSINDYRGKVTVVDMWFNGCGGCASLYTNTLSKIEAEFRGRKDFVVLSINFDRKPDQWEKGIKSGKYTSECDAINLTAGEASMNHKFVYDHGLSGMPCIFLINKSGVIEAFNTTTLYDPETLSQKIRNLLL